MAENEFLKNMGQRIMLRRRALKLTQEELAERMGVSTQMISNLELGKKAIRPENLAKLREVLGLSADFILTGGSVSSAVELTAGKLLSLTDSELAMVNDLLDYMTNRK